MKSSHIERFDLRRRAAEDIKRGISMEEVVAKYRRSGRWVGEACREFNVRLPKTREKYLSLRIYVALLSNPEKTYSEIAKLVGTSREYVSRVRKACDKLGLPYNKNRG